MSIIRKAQLIQSVRRRYRVRSFNGRGQAKLSRPGRAMLGEPSTVDVTVPDWIAYDILFPR